MGLKMNRESDVSVIIVAFNSHEHIRNCLTSVINHASRETEIVVVDNNSSDNTVSIVHSFGDRVILIENDSNTGYTGGNNLGIRSTNRPYVFLLNPDTETTQGFLNPLVSELDSNTEAAAAQPLVLLLKERSKINLTGVERHFLGFGWCRSYNRDYVPEQLKREEITAFSGSAVLLRRKSLEEVGLFDEKYFMYGDDVDLSWKLRAAGYRIVSVPKSTIYHDYSFLADKKGLEFKNKFYLIERNRFASVLTCYEQRTLILLLPILLLTEVLLALLSLTKGLLLNKIKSYLWLLTHTHWLIERRLQLLALRKRSDADLLKTDAVALEFGGLNPPRGLPLLNTVYRMYFRTIQNYLT